MIVVDSIDAIREARAALRGSVGVVPTMGALHAGHLALVTAARAENDHVLVTIFVNPMQFGPGEDLDAYPRDLPGDLAKLEAAGVDCVFTPTPALMYPSGFQTAVMVETVTQGLEGAHRPGHFRGVTTIVAKLFNLTQPTIAYFGQKDAQQVVVIRRMAADLNFPLQIAVCPTVREADGLALSSRNVYLKADERAAALVLSRALDAVQVAYADGERSTARLEDTMRRVVEAEPLAKLDYVSVVDARTLERLRCAEDDAPLLASLTAQVGQPRLLDNRLLPAHLNDQPGLTAALGRVD
ncbi:MAG: pantoate--beta-alanine ligase [Chloroflexota bacterium]